jgi:hypothetical protein
MVICFDASPESKRALDTLLETGDFRDLSEAVSMALVNYEVIVRATQRSVPVGSSSVAMESSVAKAPSAKVSHAPDLPQLFHRPSSGYGDLSCVPTPTFSSSSAATLPAKWLFGQYNRFLPVKASCRALANLLIRKSGLVMLADASREIADEAWVLGDYLDTLDHKSSRSREQVFAAGFPTTRRDGFRSKRRFAHQFVGDLTQPLTPPSAPRRFHGMPSELGFFTCSLEAKPRLQLTEAGRHFADLLNPQLDEACGQSDKFTAEELKFLQQHIAAKVPAESDAYSFIAQAITKGFTTPDAIDGYLLSHFQLQLVDKAEEPNQITKAFLTTQRTGVVSRMADLGLLSRTKNGLRVTYSLTPGGSSWLSKMS